jgi:hypothetical protein
VKCKAEKVLVGIGNAFDVLVIDGEDDDASGNTEDKEEVLDVVMPLTRLGPKSKVDKRQTEKENEKGCTVSNEKVYTFRIGWHTAKRTDQHESLGIGLF